MKLKNIFIVVLIALTLVSMAAVSAAQDNTTLYDSNESSDVALQPLAVDDEAISEDSCNETDNGSDCLLEASADAILADDSEFNVQEAYDAVNEFRAERGIWYWNPGDETVRYFNTGQSNQLMPLVRDEALEQSARIRATEYSQHPELTHTRPDGSSYLTVGPSYITAENLAAVPATTQNIMWACVVVLEEETAGYVGQPHRRAMLEPGYDCIGIAAVKANGKVYMAMEFGYRNIGNTTPVQPEQPLLDSERSFTDLKTLINNNNQVTLSKDYVYIKNDSSLKNGIEIKKSMTIDGKGHVIDGRDLARMFTVTAGNVVFKNINFKNGNSYGSKGMIYADSCKVTFINCNFTGNVAYRGGAICAANTKVSVQNCNFNNNFAVEAGAIYLDNCNSTITGSDFIENTGILRYAAVYSSKGNTTISNCNFRDNRADRYFYNPGGAVYSSDRIIAIAKSSFSNNAAINGSALSLYNADAVITDSQFDEGVAMYGGAVFSSKSSAEFRNCSFTANYLDSSRSPIFKGGAMYLVDSEISISMSNFTNNTSQDWAGTLYSSNSEISIDGSNFIGNSALGYGSALYSNKDNVSITNSNFIGNRVNTTLYVSKGGLIYSLGSNLSLKGCDVADNLYNGAMDAKGLIYSDKYISTEDCSFTNNLVMSSNLEYNFQAGGGVIYAGGGEAFVKNCNFTENVAKFCVQYNYDKYGAGAISLIGTSAHIEGSVFKSNTGEYGGAIYIDSSNATIDSCDFKGNSAKYGGAIYFSNDNMNADGCSFINNTAKSRGAAVYSDKGTAKITNSAFDKDPNTLMYGSVTLKNSTVITPKKTSIVASDFITYEKSNEAFTVKLVDGSGKAVPNREISLKIGSTTYAITTNAKGVATKKISLNPGEYKTVVTFSGDEGYLSSKRTVYITVKHKVTITSSVVKFADNIYLNLTLSKQLNATAIIDFNGMNQTYDFVNGKCNVAWSKLKNGNYAIRVYMDDDQFVYNSVSHNVVVNVKKTSLIAENFTTYEKSKEVFCVKLVDGSGNPVANKDIILNVINKNFTITTNDEGIANRSINLNEGLYKATLSFMGDDGYSACQITVYIKVKQKVKITSGLSKYADNVYLNLTLSKQINASVIVEFDGKNKTYSFTDGVCNVAWSKVKNGKHTVRVYMDDSEFVYNSVSASVTVSVKKTQIIAENFTTYDKSKEQFYVKLVDGSGNPIAGKKVILHIIGKDFPIYTNEEGIANRSINLDAGLYEATLSFNGDDDYFASGLTVYVKVKQKVKITSSLAKYSNTASLNLTLSKSINASFIINANGKNKTYNFVNGKFSIKWNNLKNKAYTIRIYMDDNDFVYNSVSESFTIDVANTYLELDDNVGIANQSTIIAAFLYEEGGSRVLNEVVEFVIGDDTLYARTSAQIGVAGIRYTFESPGTYPVTVNYMGCDGYTASSISGTVKIKEGIDPVVSTDVSYNNATISVDMSKAIDGNGVVSVNDGKWVLFGHSYWNEYPISISNGKGVLRLNNLSNRTYAFKLQFENEEYALNDGSRYYEFVINASPTELIAEDMVINAGSEIKYSVRLLEGNTGFANQSVEMILDNKVYEAVTDGDGVAVFAFNLTAGSYPVTINYRGLNNTFMPSELSRNIMVRSSAVIPQETEFSQDSQYGVTLLDGDGKPLSNQNVTVIIDNERTTMTTDALGKISFDLNLKEGTHTIEIINPATGETIKRSISIKPTQSAEKQQPAAKKPGPKIVIKTKNISVKKGKKIRFKARLYSNGKILKGKKVTFKFKGKKYRVKTNKKGIATLKLKKKLKKGKYKIKTTYGKVTVKNTIKIR